MNITKKEIVSQIASKTMLKKETVALVIDELIATIPSTLKEGNNVYLRGLGAFTVKDCKMKIGQDMGRHKAVVIPEHKAVKFKSYIEL